MESEKAALFNVYVSDWKNRIETLIKSVMLLSGGVMSITIGAFINSTPPSLNGIAVCVIQSSWYLLSLSLVASLLTFFGLVISQAIVVSDWKRRVKVNSEGLVVIGSPHWLQVICWVLGSISVLACVVGLILVAYGSSTLLSN